MCARFLWDSCCFAVVVLLVTCIDLSGTQLVINVRNQVSAAVCRVDHENMTITSLLNTDYFWEKEMFLLIMHYAIFELEKIAYFVTQ